MPSASLCEAVGYASDSAIVDSDNYLPMVETWNGQSWALQSVPYPADSDGSALTSVSCTGKDSCEAVGYFNTFDDFPLAMAEGWNGSTWTIQSVPIPSNSGVGSLSGVACTAVNACEAVGADPTTEGADAEGWNGSFWATQKLPMKADDSYLNPYGDTCTSAAVCVAVGTFEVVGQYGNSEQSYAARYS